MKKILFGIILFSATSVTSYAQDAKKVVKNDDVKKARSASEVASKKAKDAPKAATVAVVGLSQEQQDAETLKLKKATKNAPKAKVKPVVAAETAENAGH